MSLSKHKYVNTSPWANTSPKYDIVSQFLKPLIFPSTPPIKPTPKIWYAPTNSINKFTSFNTKYKKMTQ